MMSALLRSQPLSGFDNTRSVEGACLSGFGLLEASPDIVSECFEFLGTS